MYLVCPVALVTAALTFKSADAHGYISNSAAQFVDPDKSTFYVKTMTANVNRAFGGLRWDDSPEANAATFTSSFAKAGYSSLRDMLDQQVTDCANTRTDVSPVDVSDLTAMTWQNNPGVITHRGPCEVWIDEIMMNHRDNCLAGNVAVYSMEISTDFSKCSDKCTLRFYWLALYEPNWQIVRIDREQCWGRSTSSH
ncbi:hypothetical protein PHYSODRAFT_257305 [Phytophthora sojae]|uniref:Uncharacterized protein n=1 Tax=Phytophthora sojae (strain P6497) TaxID=1094619 RepID=G4YEJ7_PHYSP|nr:hypothetical protein PHYSODRAFT_257305 [Phytophthora sojae]EGZ27274.1 hypothetical protein PHYSODRAFT_257305 [Phytophthora sojae]|eukprot:XP_009514549.1 hypothetical protein PHYSODRAFT_257305 [Phytophthora sojae]